MNSFDKQLWSQKIQERALSLASKLFGNITPPSTIHKLKLQPKHGRAVLSWKMKIPGQSNVELVAKRDEADGGRMENLIYTRILPHMGLSNLRCFGFVEEENEQFTWIFMEHAGHNEYNSNIKEHVSIAGKWLSVLHGSHLEPELKGHFRKCDDEYYAASLRTACTLVKKGKTNSSLSHSQQEILSRTLHLLNKLKARWSVVEDMCSSVPKCLIHGDFLGKNLRIEAKESEYRLKVFDWNAASWGFPFLDLAESLLPTSNWLSSNLQPDIDSYLSCSQEWWPQIDRKSLRCFIGLGNIFWALECIKGDAECFKFEWVGDNILEKICIYSHVLDYGLRGAKLSTI